MLLFLLFPSLHVFVALLLFSVFVFFLVYPPLGEETSVFFSGEMSRVCLGCIGPPAVPGPRAGLGAAGEVSDKTTARWGEKLVLASPVLTEPRCRAAEWGCPERPDLSGSWSCSDGPGMLVLRQSRRSGCGADDEQSASECAFLQQTGQQGLVQAEQGCGVTTPSVGGHFPFLFTPKAVTRPCSESGHWQPK